MFFSKMGQYEPAGMFGLSHIALAVCTLILVGVALFFAMKLTKKGVMNLLKVLSITIIVFEIVKDWFIVKTLGFKMYESWIPLFYCGTFLFALFVTAFCSGKAQNIGFAFVTMGAIAGGLTFILIPETSLSYYPIFHFISLHSFIYHGAMVFSGLIILLKGIYKPNLIGVVDYFIFTGLMTVCAFSVNTLCDLNLMFLKQPVDLWPLNAMYKFNHTFYSIMFVIGQDIGIYLFSFGIYSAVMKIIKLCRKVSDFTQSVETEQPTTRKSTKTIDTVEVSSTADSNIATDIEVSSVPDELK